MNFAAPHSIAVRGSVPLRSAISLLCLGLLAAGMYLLVNRSTPVATSMVQSPPTAVSREASVLKVLAQNGTTAQTFLDSDPVQSWARQDPAGLMSWLGTHEAPLTKGGVPAGLKVAIEEWTKTDPNPCSKWLEDHPDYPHRDHAIRYLVEFLAPNDLLAATKWVTKITDPALQAKARTLLDNH